MKKKNEISGLTDVQERQKLKAALRQMWRKSSRANHIKKVRFKHPDPNSRYTYGVQCVHCGCIKGQSQKTYYSTKTGRRRRTGAYHVNHILDTSLPPVKDITKDLGVFAEALIHTPLEIVCVDCHKTITAQQVINKREAESHN